MATNRHSTPLSTRKQPSATPKAPATILAIDIGGSKIKIPATGQAEPRRTRSGKGLTPMQLVEAVRELAGDREYEAVSIGYPGQVGDSGPRSEPGNLGLGWVGFNFAAAFERPVRILNDAAMQALGSYEGGRMLFLGLGTGLGSTLISENVIVPLELGRLRSRGRETWGEILGHQGLERLGKQEWRRAVKKAAGSLAEAFLADYVVLGGGNAKELRELPPGVRLGHNLTAFRGGFRLWGLDDVRTLSADGEQEHPPACPAHGMAADLAGATDERGRPVTVAHAGGRPRRRHPWPPEMEGGAQAGQPWLTALQKPAPALRNLKVAATASATAGLFPLTLMTS